MYGPVTSPSMPRRPPRSQEVLRLDLDAAAFKEFLRDLLFREAGKSYFKRLAIPRRYRLLGAWRTLSTYQAERQLLPVGGRNTDDLIRQFFLTNTCLRAEFQQGGMPITAIRVLRQAYPLPNPALEYVACLECTLESSARYQVHLVGDPAPPAPPADRVPA
jgi:hypothetical protein